MIKTQRFGEKYVWIRASLPCTKSVSQSFRRKSATTSGPRHPSATFFLRRVNMAALNDENRFHSGDATRKECGAKMEALPHSYYIAVYSKIETSDICLANHAKEIFSLNYTI